MMAVLLLVVLLFPQTKLGAAAARGCPHNVALQGGLAPQWRERFELWTHSMATVHLSVWRHSRLFAEDFLGAVRPQDRVQRPAGCRHSLARLAL